MAGRGANGRSTIVKQDDGRWHGFVSMGAKGDGSRDRRHVSASTRAAVVEKVKALEAKRAGTGEQVETAPAVEPLAEPVE